MKKIWNYDWKIRNEIWINQIWRSWNSANWQIKQKQKSRTYNDIFIAHKKNRFVIEITKFRSIIHTKSRSIFCVLLIISYATKAKTQQFIRRKSNFIKKTDELTRLYHANFALIIRKNDKYYIYRFIDHNQWFFRLTKIVCLNETQIIRALIDV